MSLETTSIEVSADRITVTAIAGAPLGAPCRLQPAGVEVEIEEEVATVTFLVTASKEIGEVCTSACPRLIQVITLDQPLAKDTRVVSSPGAVRTCDPGL